jgi:hypothetical protein
VPNFPPDESVPALVSLHVWGVPSHQIGTAVLRMGLDRRAARRASGVRFAKMLGTADGRGFGVRDADPHHWGLLTTWDDPAAAEAFEQSRTVRAWDAISTERLLLHLRPISSRGSWSGRAPFGDPTPSRPAGAVAALTRARIRPRLWHRFWSSVPPVAVDLDSRSGAGGLLLSLGIGEAPVGLQGTFSLWSSASALQDFAHRGAAHAAAIRATDELDWYSEELFARFAVESATGTYRGRDVNAVITDAAPDGAAS